MERFTPEPKRRVGPLANVAALLAVAVLAVACTSPSSNRSVASLPGTGGQTHTTGSPTVAQSDQDFVNFARCMRSHGVPTSDPSHRPGHEGLSIDLPVRDAATNGAWSVCNHFIADIEQAKGAGATNQLSAAALAAFTNYAQCMRSHDIPMLDPAPQGQLNLGNVPGITSDFGRYSPQFRSADSACRHLLPPGVRDDGTGP